MEEGAALVQVFRDPLWILGFAEGRIQTRASVEVKVKESLLVKLGDRQWLLPRQSSPSTVQFTSFIEAPLMQGKGNQYGE